ncbi:hypothetical protein UlMin_009458 [Ulmus minor]
MVDARGQVIIISFSTFVLSIFFFCITGLLITCLIYFGHLPLTPSAIFTQGFATSSHLNEMHQSEILIPALQSHWLMMHVSMMVLGLCPKKNNVLPNIYFLSSRNYYKFQLIQQLDLWNYHIISLGFIFLTVCILLVAIWANEVLFIYLFIIWICYFGVNEFGTGLHSYSSFTLTY